MNPAPAVLKLIAVSIAIAPIASAQSTYKGLAITPEVNTPAYKRSQWKHWIDEDGDGQDARQEVLIAESLLSATFNAQGKVSRGLWVGPYCGFVTRDPSDIQIDHMIPLKETHQSGGHAWTKAEKEAYANDLSNAQHLIASKGGCNGSKGAKDPSEWMPPNRTYWCQYLNDWVEIKQKWKLTVDQAEVDALKVGFRVCKKYKSGDALEGRH